MNDLIERLETEAHNCEEDGRFNPGFNGIAKLLREAIAALSPVLPEDVQSLISYHQGRMDYETADMLERLQREKTAVAKARDHHVDKMAQYFARIAELEEEVVYWRNSLMETSAEPEQGDDLA